MTRAIPGPQVTHAPRRRYKNPYGSRARIRTTRGRLPDFLIIGAMKCGTTTLWDFISRHPDVEMPTLKEIHYFTLNYRKGEEWYARFFAHVPPGKVTGEASPTYFDLANGPTIPNLIEHTLPGVRLIVIIKDPVDRALSHFHHLKAVERVPAFQTLDPSDIFAGDLARKYHDEFIRNPDLWPMRRVLEFGQYYIKLIEYLTVFNDRVLVIPSIGLLNDGPATMRTVFAHLRLYGFESETFSEAGPVTHLRDKQVSDEARAALQEFYRADIELVRKLLGVDRL